MPTYVSPAKVNLFLRILHRRQDGYHALASLMQTIGLCDLLTIEPFSHDRLTCSDASLPMDHSNLVVKALTLFRKKTGRTTPFSIHLDKKIPQQAGLGGGSSNAATTLWALNELCGSPATEIELKIWSAELGSDVPFFFSKGIAYCTGRGEIIQELAPMNEGPIRIIKPQCSLSTPLVYRNLHVDQLECRDPEQALASFQRGEPLYFNDLEAPAFLLIPELKKLKSELQVAGFSTVLMSGSGSSFFCLGEGTLPSQPVQCFDTQFVHRASTWF